MMLSDVCLSVAYNSSYKSRTES